jgi:hypothetical protein
LNTVELIDLFRSKFGVKTDAHMAKLLDVNPDYLKFWRSGHIAMPLSMRLRLQTHTGQVDVVDHMTRFSDQDIHQRLLARDRARLDKLN